LGAALTSAGIASIEIPQNVLQILQKRSAKPFRAAETLCKTFCKCYLGSAEREKPGLRCAGPGY
jgi:hypothetical protein